MKARWQAWATRFHALQLRERLLVLIALLAATVFGLHQLVIAPAYSRAAAARTRVASAQAEQQRLQAQLAALGAEAADPDRALRAQLGAARARIAEVDGRLSRLRSMLVPPQRVPALLQELIGASKGLRLIALKSLPAAPLVDASAARPAGASDAASPPLDQRSEVEVYRHGVEISVAGRYEQLLAYLAALETGEGKLYWSSARLRVEDYPVSVLTIKVYTLSLERIWLRV